MELANIVSIEKYQRLHSDMSSVKYAQIGKRTVDGFWNVHQSPSCACMGIADPPYLYQRDAGDVQSKYKTRSSK